MPVFQFFWLLLILALELFVQSHENFDTCATTTKALVNHFNLRDGSMFENLLDLELQTRINLTVWWRIHPTCNVKYCTGAYMTTQCGNVEAGNVSFSSSWGSVLCTCKTCDCLNDMMGEHVCARLYLKPDDCSVCNAAYTEIPPGQNDAFPEIWYNKIANIVVQADCNLTIFEKEDFMGSSKFISGPFIENRTKSLASWKCICNSGRKLVHHDARSKPEGFSTTHIPDSLDDVIELLSERRWMHQGLLASLSALSNGISSKNVYILMLGSSGAGKSSVINALLGQNLTMVGDYASITSQIVEYRIPFPLHSLGIQNSELRFIDTPGLGDTGGIENDAAFMATLENYLTTHSELKSRKPNFVLILHSFNDNRFSDEASNFIRMVRAFDTLRPLITNERYPNVLFLFTHLCSVSFEQQRNPRTLLKEFKQAVEKFTLFPKPVLATVGENLGTRQNLVMRNGNTQLPNFELYPQNVLDKMDFISRKNGDKIANALVNSPEMRNRNLDNAAISKIEHPLVGSSHQSIAKYLKIIQMTAFGVSSTEVSVLLTEAYKTMSSDLKFQFPNALQELQKLLYQQGIISKASILNTLTAKLDVILKTQHNLAMQYLLQNGLQLFPPSFPGKLVVGESYDIFKQITLPTQIFKMIASKKFSTIGFDLPNFIKCTKLDSFENPTNTFYMFNTEQQYFEHRIATYLDSKLVSKPSSKLYSSIVGNLKPGYFVKSIKYRDSIHENFCFIVVRKYNTFQLELNPEIAVIQPEFLKTLNALPEYYEHNYENVQRWTNFFREYGTHIITSAEGGGQLRIQFNIPAVKDLKVEVNKVIKIIKYIEDPQQYALANQEVYKWVVGNASSVKYKLTFQGGDRKYYKQDFSSSSLEQSFGEFSKWRKSLKYFPVVFSKNVVPIHKLVRKFVVMEKQAKVEKKIEIAFERLLSGTLKYTEDPKIIAERERQKKEEEHRRIHQQKLLIEKMKKEHEAVRRQLEEERQRKVAEAKALEEARRQQEREQAVKARIMEQQRQEEMEQRRQRYKEELKRFKMEKCLRDKICHINLAICQVILKTNCEERILSSI